MKVIINAIVEEAAYIIWKKFKYRYWQPVSYCLAARIRTALERSP